MIEVNEYVRIKDGIIDKVIIEYDGKRNNSNCNETVELLYDLIKANLVVKE